MTVIHTELGRVGGVMSARVLTVIVETCGECPKCILRYKELDFGYCDQGATAYTKTTLSAPPPDFCPLPKLEEKEKERK